MKRFSFILLTASLAAMCVTAAAQPVPRGQFPFFRSFMDGRVEDISFPTGTGGRANAASEETSLTDDGLVLTTGTA